MKKFDKMVQQDAEAWLAAEMFYGEGAGIRRRHLNAEITTKMADPAYEQAFEKAYNALDQNKFAKLAIKERKAADRAIKAGQNLRALKSGNYSNLTTGVAVVLGVAYLAHKTGYDKKIEAEAKKLYKKAKTEIRFQKLKAKGLNVEKII